jgi:hypothetical protein
MLGHPKPLIARRLSRLRCCGTVPQGIGNAAAFADRDEI